MLMIFRNVVTGVVNTRKSCLRSECCCPSNDLYTADRMDLLTCNSKEVCEFFKMICRKQKHPV